MSKNNVEYSFAPDGFMSDGTPIYFKCRPSEPSPLQLKIYAALADPSKPIPEEVLGWLRKSVGDR